MNDAQFIFLYVAVMVFICGLIAGYAIGYRNGYLVSNRKHETFSKHLKYCDGFNPKECDL